MAGGCVDGSDDREESSGTGSSTGGLSDGGCCSCAVESLWDVGEESSSADWMVLTAGGPGVEGGGEGGCWALSRATKASPDGEPGSMIVTDD